MALYTANLVSDQYPQATMFLKDVRVAHAVMFTKLEAPTVRILQLLRIYNYIKKMHHKCFFFLSRPVDHGGSGIFLTSYMLKQLQGIRKLVYKIVHWRRCPRMISFTVRRPNGCRKATPLKWRQRTANRTCDAYYSHKEWLLSEQVSKSDLALGVNLSNSTPTSVILHRRHNGVYSMAQRW